MMRKEEPMRLIDADALKRRAQRVATEAWKMKLTAKIETTLNQFIDWINDAPTIEPEPHYDEWCTDCKEYDHERHCCPRWNRVIRETLKDAQTERKKGKWQITDAYPHNVYCSECHKRFAQTHWGVWEDGSLPRNFCPNCGADMRGEQNG